MKNTLATNWRHWLPLAVLLMILTTGAQMPDPWATLQQERANTTGAGYIQRLRTHNFTVEQARQTLDCLSEAQRQGVPVATLTTRLDEGLAKKAEPQAIATALQARLRVMTQARTMLKVAHYDTVAEEPRNELLTTTGLALESGVAAEDIGAVLKRGNGQSALRMKSVVEAGESLHLAGVDHATTQSLMSDCLDRNLRRMEVLRAVRYSIQQHRGGMSGDNIRRSLWGGNTATEGARGWRNGGQGGSGACETGGAGSGAGAGNGWRGGSGAGGSGGNATGGSGGGGHQHMGGTK